MYTLDFILRLRTMTIYIIQIAKAREMFLWLGTFYLVAGTGMIMGFAK